MSSNTNFSGPFAPGIPASSHLALVQGKLPQWLVRAPSAVHSALREGGLQGQSWFQRLQRSRPEVATALQQDYRLHLFNEAQLSGALGELPSLEAFAEPLLASAIKERFGVTLDVRDSYLFHARRVQVDDSFAGASADPFVQLQNAQKAATQTLLHAALQNFELWETEPGGLDLDARHKAYLYEHRAIAGSSVEQSALPILPHEFAGLCRELDLGGKYQKKISAFLSPPSKPGDAPDAAAFNRRGLLKRVEQTAFRIQVHLAHLKGDLGIPLYRALLSVAENRKTVELGTQPMTWSFLKLWDVELTGIVVIGPARDHAEEVQPVVVYLPDDPVSPIKEYPSTIAFCHALRDRMLKKGYLEFFRRYVQARHWVRLHGLLSQRLWPTVWNREMGWYDQQPDATATLHLRESVITTGVLTALVQQKTFMLKDDALFHAVPTAEEDQKTFAQRVHYFESAALQILNAVGFVVPAVGAAMMAVTAAQLAVEVFEGVDSWTRGEWVQGWGYISDVLENLALMASLGLAQEGATPAMETLSVETPSFIEELDVVEAPDGKSRLWKPDLAPFAHDTVLPRGLQPDESGIYHYQNKTWVSVDDKVYAVRVDPSSGQYRVLHPTKAEAWQPPLKSNGAGAWLHPADRPLEWQGVELFRRLGHRVDDFSALDARRILQVSGTSETALRRALAESERPAALLDDTICRFRLDQELRQAAEHGESASRRAALFESRYREKSQSRDPKAGSITHRYPQLPGGVVDELIRAATASELEVLAHGHVPVRLAQEVRVYQQQIRLARAYEGLYLESVRNPDTDTLILHTVATLEGWSPALRLEVRTRGFSGPLVDAVGPADSALRKVLVRTDDGFETFDEQGHSLHGRDDIYASILHALPDAQRTALGFPGTWDGPRLKQAIQLGPLLPRHRLREVMKMQPAQPGHVSPMRLADGRLGYALSGQGAMADMIGRDTLLDLVRSLNLDADTSAEHVLQTLEGAGLSRVQIHQRLSQMLEERNVLESALRLWDDGDPGLERELTSRAEIQRAIWSHWAAASLPETAGQPPVLRLQHIVLSDFPPSLPDFFQHQVRRLELVDINVSRPAASGPQPVFASVDQRLALEAFFGRFPGVQALEVSRTNTVGREPLVFQMPHLIVQSFPGLRSLRLVNQDLWISFMEVESLTRLQHLELLDLSGNHISITPPSNMLELQVRTLRLDNLGLDHWPAWLGDLTSSTLRELSLRNNRLTEIPNSLVSQQASAVESVEIHLQGNPLSRVMLTRIRLEESPTNRLRFQVDIPHHLSAQVTLLRRERQQLLEALDSWEHASTSTQPLTESTVAARSVTRQHVMDFWRAYSEGQTHAVLTLEGISLAEFPPSLPDFFYMGVRNVQLVRVSAEGSELNPFLARFTQLQNLEMTGRTEPLPELPSVLRHMPRLRALSLRDQGRFIDQQAITFLGGLPHLESLDLGGNTLGEISDASGFRHRLRWLALDDTGLEAWPEWIEHLMPLEALTLDRNRLTELPDHILENPRSDHTQTEIAVRGNPLTYETLRRAHLAERYHGAYAFVMDWPDEILMLPPERRWSDSDSDDYASGSDSSGALNSPSAVPPEEVPDAEQWLLGTPDENAAHQTLWQRLDQRADAPNLMALVGRLTQSAPYRNLQTRNAFAERVWRVLEVADQRLESRLLFNGIAEEALLHDDTGFQTCHDGAWLVFNQIEIQMFIEQSVGDAAQGTRGASLYRLTRRLYRLDELDATAREQAEGRDEAEVRLAYRLRWASELDLPLPPSNMLYQVHACIRTGELDAALARVQLGEQGEPFMRYAAQRDFWVQYLRETYAERFEALKEDYLTRVTSLPDQHPGRTIDELGDEFAALKRAYDTEEEHLIRELTYREGFEQS
ncbi:MULTISPECIES: DUF6543 domain-containing protein [unclassified Pseudomonas]|uniref:dermonecrotic toxin domain-containing protein n=1 Tax=unclassified Pseudomonas TaxID=196821 RepID=UPI000D37629B|nr:hypothetical protein DBP26_010550 [Pseudomonas sp. RIT 409]RAU52391.1 hypothetical protein DBY65_017300 [Pseudomonas sp. RIT 412]